jgi:hypothetical protein
MTDDLSRKSKRLICAVLFGLAITAFSSWPLWGASFDGLELILMSLLMMPGAIVAIAVAGNPHVFSRSIVVTANLAIYTGLVYALLCIRRHSVSVVGKKLEKKSV